MKSLICVVFAAFWKVKPVLIVTTIAASCCVFLYSCFLGKLFRISLKLAYCSLGYFVSKKKRSGGFQRRAQCLPPKRAKNNKSQRSQEAKRPRKQKPQKAEKPQKPQKPRSQTKKQAKKCKKKLLLHKNAEHVKTPNDWIWLDTSSWCWTSITYQITKKYPASNAHAIFLRKIHESHMVLGTKLTPRGLFLLVAWLFYAIPLSLNTAWNSSRTKATDLHRSA